MQILRKHSKVVIIITAFVFIVGMALMGLSGVFAQKKNFLGQIGKTKITIQEFSEVFKSVVYNYTQGLDENQTLTEKELIALNDNTWQNLVQRNIIEKAIKKFDIKITANQIAKNIKNNPPKEVLSIPELQTDGKFDEQKYLTAIEEGAISIKALEDYFRETLLMSSLKLAVTGKIVITDEDVRQDFIESNQFLNAKIIWFNPEKIVLKDAIPEKDLLEAYEANKPQFKKEETREFDYVAIKFDKNNVAEKEKVKQKTQELLDLARVEGFLKACKQLKIEGESPLSIAKGSFYFPNIGLDNTLGEKMFEQATIGDISDMVISEEHISLFCLKSIDVDPYFSFDRVRDILETSLKAQKQNLLAMQNAQEFYKIDKDYLARAKNQKIDVISADNINISSPLPQIGYVEQLSKSLFSRNKGEYTEIVSQEYKGAMIGYVKNKVELDWEKFKEQKNDLQKALTIKKENTIFNNWFSEQYNLLKIKDYRYKFFEYIKEKKV